MRVSVAMPTYNGAAYVEAQLRSILVQLEDGDEVVVVDDASTDDTRARIDALADPRIRLHASPSNRGVLASVEAALRLTRNEIVFLADQDDLWTPDKRSTFCALFAARPAVTLAISDAAIIDADGAPVAPSFMAFKGGFRGGLVATLVRNRYIGCAMAFRRTLLDVALPFPPDLPMHDMWLGALNALAGEVAYVDRPLVQYRRHGDNASPLERRPIGTMLRWRWRLLKNVCARAFRGARPEWKMEDAGRGRA